MGEFRYVWVNTRLIVLTALSAALYAVILVPFKIGLVFIPGVTEWRPANAIPIVCSLLFGPAAAWGTAFGNLIGDMFGTLGPGSIGGFVGNFLYGFLPYATWRAIAGTKPQLRSLWDLLLYVLVALTASAACAFVIAWWVDLVRVAPFAPVSIIILVNNFAMAVLLGPPLLFILQPAVATWQLTYERINPEIAVRHPVRHIIGWALIAIACAIGIALRRMPALEGTFLSQHFGLVGATAPLLIMVIIGAVLLTNRIRMPVRVAPLMEVTPSAGELAWQVSHLSFAYPGSDSHALRDINLVQHWGETIIVMGASGAGKSTLCKCLTGIIPHVQPGDCVGEVRVMGRSVTESSVSSLSQHIGLVLQDFEAQLFSTRVDLEVAFACENASLPRTEIEQRVQRALQGVGLSGLEARAPATLSGGQKQRLAIASVLALEPPIIVLDEPTSDLDPVGKQEIFQLRRWLADDRNAILMVEHETEEAIDADRIVLLRNGEVVADGNPSDVLTDVQLLEQCGVRPPAGAILAHRLGSRDAPLTVDEAVEFLKGIGARVDSSRLEELQQRDMQYRARYGAPIIELEGVSFSYSNGADVLHDVSLTIREGEFIAIVGQNGCGKTTLVKLFNGLLHPTGGVVRICGKPTTQATQAELAQSVGYVFQNPDHQISAPTVFDEVAFAPRNFGMGSNEVEQRVRLALEAVHLTGYEDRSPFLLSKGERQRIAVASVLAAQPRVLVLDEPTTGLDYHQQRSVMELLAKLNREHGHTVVVITHSMWLVCEYAHRCIVVHRGRILADDIPRKVFSNDELLAETSLRSPEIMRIGSALGIPACTVDELLFCLCAGDA